MTTLARLFDITRFERRPLGTGKLGTLSPPALEVVVALLDSFHFETPGAHTPYLRVGTLSSPFSSFTFLISSFYCHPDRGGGIVAKIVRSTIDGTTTSGTSRAQPTSYLLRGLQLGLRLRFQNTTQESSK